MRMHTHEIAIDTFLVQKLLASQFPNFADREVSIVEPWGTDNAVWRLGSDLVIRMPRIESAVDQIAFEDAWLPQIGPHLSVPVPEPVAVGVPGIGYPFPWAIHRWLPGERASLERIADPIGFALELARTVEELRRVPAVAAPTAKNRGRPLADYDEDTRTVIAGAAHLIDADAALAVWEEALAAPPHDGAPTWVHGDLEGNCLVRDGRLGGLIDWGLGCVGDPAVDIQVVWSPLFTSSSREVFLRELEVGDAALARSRGAAVNQACGALPYYLNTYPLIVERSWHKLAQLGIAARH